MMIRQHHRFAGFSLALVLLGTGTAAADDAKKRDLKLAKCAADYRTALSACEKLTDAAACYTKADADDRACRNALGAAGNSQVEPEFGTRRKERLSLRKLPLNCGTGLNATCADGHARLPICTTNSQQDLNASQGIGGNTSATVVQDADGDKDRCTGTVLKCPAGFTLVARKGQDLCWDSAQNLSKYQY